MLILFVKGFDLLNIKDCNGWNVMLFVLFYGNKLVILFLRKNYREVCIVLGIIFVNIFYLVCLSGNSSFYIEF